MIIIGIMTMAMIMIMIIILVSLNYFLGTVFVFIQGSFSPTNSVHICTQMFYCCLFTNSRSNVKLHCSSSCVNIFCSYFRWFPFQNLFEKHTFMIPFPISA